jgi:hypothetical protein
MTKPLTDLDAVDACRLPDGQEAWAKDLIQQIAAALDALLPEERALFRDSWTHIASYAAPAAPRQLGPIHRNLETLQRTVLGLNARRLLWFDDDLRAVLQNPPFSALHTPHQVKVFGWERVYVTSFVDIPVTLLIYGPNVWLTAESLCPRSGEPLIFRVKMREDGTLLHDAPSTAQQWRVWLPLPETPSTDCYVQFHLLRPRIHAFLTSKDLDSHRHYANCGDGVTYTLEQAVYLSQLLIAAYRHALA